MESRSKIAFVVLAAVVIAAALGLYLGWRALDGEQLVAFEIRPSANWLKGRWYGGGEGYVDLRVGEMSGGASGAQMRVDSYLDTLCAPSSVACAHVVGQGLQLRCADGHLPPPLRLREGVLNWHSLWLFHEPSTVELWKLRRRRLERMATDFAIEHF